MTIRQVAPAQVRDALRSGTEIALLDLRPEAVFAQGHPLFAANLPLGRIEVEVYDRIPRRATPVVLYGRDVLRRDVLGQDVLRRDVLGQDVLGRDGAAGQAGQDERDVHGRDGGDGRGSRGGPGGDTIRAAAVLSGLGYTDVSVLEGGLAGWESSGGELFSDVNAPSKAFGELVESVAHTPMIAPEDLAALLARGDAPVIVDARRYDEYHTMSIPTSTSVPGAELVLRIAALAPDPSTLVVVNCAGRTRSIIGTQSLRNAGVANQVLALRNGTIGWTLAGLDLAHGQARRHPSVGPEVTRRAAEAADALARRAGVGHVRLDQVAALADGGTRTVYRFDVRTPEEFAAGRLAGFRCAPGGQLVQETDHFAPVRGARIALYSGDGVRAEMTGSWLAQMGWEVCLLDSVPDDALEESGAWKPSLPPLPDVAWVTPEELAGSFGRGEAQVVDLDPSPRYRAGHVPGAVWAARFDIAEPVPGRGPVVVTSADGTLAAFAAADIDAGVPGRPVTVLAGGTQGWVVAGFPLEQGASSVVSPVEDVYRRPYEGTDVDPDAMQAYLEWEYGLVGQLERDGTHGFTVLT
jgi:rhodanese-related sulfurtransferase